MNILIKEFVDSANAETIQARSQIRHSRINELNGSIANIDRKLAYLHGVVTNTLQGLFGSKKTTTPFLNYDGPRSHSQGKTLDDYALSQKHHRKI